MTVRARGFAALVLLAAAPLGLLAACSSGDVSGEASVRGGSGAHAPKPAGSPSSAPGAGTPAPNDPSSPSEPPPPPPFVASDETMFVGTATRGYVLVVPRTIDPARRYPLVVAMHGDGGNGGWMRAALGLENVTGANAIVVYPSGWNATWDLYNPSDTNADEGYLVQLVASLAGKLPIDTARVFATGFSSGAFMANQMACRKPTLFRAIASHGGGAPAEPQDPTATTWGDGFVRCAGQTSGVAALAVHGEDDGVVSPESGAYTARYWAQVDGCSVSTSPAPGMLGAAGCVQHDQCPQTLPVVLCEKPGLGHALATDAASLTWAFFSSL